MQQVVSGALLLGALSKWGEIVAAFGLVHVLAVVVVAGVGLIAAVLAAQLRHDYRMWGVKGTTAALADRDDQEAALRFSRANRYLRAMRIAMWGSSIAICLGVAALLAGAWLVASKPDAIAQSLTPRQQECREVAAWVASQSPEPVKGSDGKGPWDAYRKDPIVGSPKVPWSNHAAAVGEYFKCMSR